MNEFSTLDNGVLGGPSPNLPSEDASRTQAGLLQLLSMLGEEADFEQSDSEDEWESMDEDGDGDEDEEAN